MVDDVPENLAGVGAQEVPVVVAEKEVVHDRKQEITDEDVQQESQSDLGEQSFPQTAHCQVEDDGDEGEDGGYQDGGGVDDARQLPLICLDWSFLSIANPIASVYFL